MRAMEKRKRNGLEVTCIGSLYQGAWEKKYWSSSRGKDRYPYPVGYQAVRCYNGQSYHMEVQEGGRGPLFVVSFGEGMKFSADTPTIAWQGALKKASSLSKKMPGRLLSTEINGSELFGFMDPLVQRLFRELISLQDGEAQPDENVSPDNKADKSFQQKSTRHGSPEGFGWGSTRTAPVRKSRTSIVHSEIKVSSLCGESSLNHPSHVKGGRKRLKLAKPTKKTREESELKLSVPSDVASPQGASFELSQPKGESRDHNLATTKIPQDHICLAVSKKAADLAQEHPKKEVLQGAVVPDSFDEFSSEIPAGVQGEIQTKLSLENIACNVRDKNLAPIAGSDACLPSQGLSPSLSNSCVPHKIRSFKEKVHTNSSQRKLSNLESNIQDLNSPSKNAREIQLTNAVVPDSWDNDSGVMLINEACSPAQAVVAYSPLVGEQTVVDADKCPNSPPYDAKDDGQSSEGNTQRGESDSLGQELTKSMIRLLLPQALQLIDNKERKRKQPTTLKVANQEIEAEVELLSGEKKLAGLDENKPCCPTSFPNQLNGVQVLDSESIPKEAELELFSGEKLAGLDENEPCCPTSFPNQLDGVQVLDPESIPKEAESELLSGEKLAGLDENEPCCPTSFPNQLDGVQVLDSERIPKEDIVSISAEGGGVCPGADQLLLQNVGSDQSSGASICDSDFLKLVDEICLEKLDKVEQINDELINGIDLWDAQPSKNNANLANLAYQQDQRDVNYQLVSCTAVPCDNTVLPDKTAPVESPPSQSFSPKKQQIHDVNDRASASTFHNSPKSRLVVEDECRSLADHSTNSLEHSCPKNLEIKELYLPTPNSLKLVDISKELSTGIGAVTVEKSTTQFKAEYSSKESELAHNLGTDASVTAGGASITVIKEDILAASLAFCSDKSPQNHAVKGPLTCQELNHKETKCAEDDCVEQVYRDDFEHEAKDSLRVQLPQTEAFVPKACLEHPMPVLAMKINVQEDQAHFFICCGVQNTRVLFVYQTSRKEFKASLISSITFDILDSMCDAVSKGLVEANGIQFTPDGQELLLLGTFIVRETTNEKQASLVQKHTYFHGLQLVSYAEGKVCVHTRLDTYGIHVYSALFLDTCMVIAGGENGFVTCWIMDTLWRSCKQSFTLPVPEGHQFSHVIQLSGVPALPWIVIGCDHRGFISIWNSNSESRRLLRVLKLSVESPSELHLLHMDLVIQSSHDELNKDTPMMNVWRNGGNKVFEKVAASFLVSTSDCNRMAPSDSAVQTASRRWSLELFKRNGTSAVFDLDQLHQRVSTVEVLDGLGISGMNDGCVHLWDIRSGSVRRTFSELKGEPVVCIARDQACSIIAVAGSSGRVMMYMKQTERELVNGRQHPTLNSSDAQNGG